MRYRLRTLLVAIVLCAIIANAIASERNATKQVIQLDAAVMIALAKLNPEVSERFDVDYLNDSDDELSSYLFRGNIATASVGGVLSGQRKIERVIRVEDQAAVTVEIKAPWSYLCCGMPEVSIDFSPSRGNQWFARRLASELIAENDFKVRLSTP